MIRKNKYTSNVFLHRFGSRTSNQHCNNHGLDRSAQLRESCRWQHLLYWCWSELRDGCDARFVYLSFRHTLVISKRSWKKLSFFKPLTFIHISQLTLECVYCAQTAPSSSTPGTGIEGIQQIMASQSLTDTHIRHGGQVRSWFWLYWYSVLCTMQVTQPAAPTNLEESAAYRQTMAFYNGTSLLQVCLKCLNQTFSCITSHYSYSVCLKLHYPHCALVPADTKSLQPNDQQSLEIRLTPRSDSHLQKVMLQAVRHGLCHYLSTCFAFWCADVLPGR